MCMPGACAHCTRAAGVHWRTLCANSTQTWKWGRLLVATTVTASESLTLLTLLRSQRQRLARCLDPHRDYAFLDQPRLWPRRRISLAPQVHQLSKLASMGENDVALLGLRTLHSGLALALPPATFPYSPSALTTVPGSSRRGTTRKPLFHPIWSKPTNEWQWMREDRSGEEKRTDRRQRTMSGHG